MYNWSFPILIATYLTSKIMVYVSWNVDLRLVHVSEFVGEVVWFDNVDSVINTKREHQKRLDQHSFGINIQFHSFS